MANQLGRHSFSLDAFMGKDLDQLVKVISGALQEVDVKQHASEAPPGAGGTGSSRVTEADRGPSVNVVLKQDQSLTSGKELGPKLKDPEGPKKQGVLFVVFLCVQS